MAVPPLILGAGAVALYLLAKARGEGPAASPTAAAAPPSSTSPYPKSEAKDDTLGKVLETAGTVAGVAAPIITAVVAAGAGSTASTATATGVTTGAGAVAAQQLGTAAKTAATTTGSLTSTATTTAGGTAAGAVASGFTATAGLAAFGIAAMFQAAFIIAAPSIWQSFTQGEYSNRHRGRPRAELLKQAFYDLWSTEVGELKKLLEAMIKEGAAVTYQVSSRATETLSFTNTNTKETYTRTFSTYAISIQGLSPEQIRDAATLARWLAVFKLRTNNVWRTRCAMSYSIPETWSFTGAGLNDTEWAQLEQQVGSQKGLAMGPGVEAARIIDLGELEAWANANASRLGFEDFQRTRRLLRMQHILKTQKHKSYEDPFANAYATAAAASGLEYAGVGGVPRVIFRGVGTPGDPGSNGDGYAVDLETRLPAIDLMPLALAEALQPWSNLA